MKKRESLDLALILIWPIIATIFSFLFKLNAFGSIITFLIIPSLYLSIQGKGYVKKAAIFSAILSIPTIIAIDYMAQVTDTWLVNTVSILPFKFFELVTFEVILWAFFTCYFIVIFYEYFLDKHVTHKLWKPKMKYLILILLIGFSTFLVSFFKLKFLMNIPYFYLFWGILLLAIPFLIQILKYSKTTSKFFIAAAYFFYLNFLYEVAGLKLGWWIFQGTQYLGWVSLFGVGFPIEEVLFWFILMAFGVLSYYEYFDDDEK